MKIFLDFEFTGLHQATTPISVGIITADAREFYWEFTDYNIEDCSKWVIENVINNLMYKKDEKFKLYTVKGTEVEDIVAIKSNHYSLYAKGTREEASACLYLWLQQFYSVEAWGDCLSYDWVLFCELFGGALNIPAHMCYVPRDIGTLFAIKNLDVDTPRELFAGAKKCGKQHNALHDANVIRECFYKLITPF